jgi:hypothetical protein
VASLYRLVEEAVIKEQFKLNIVDKDGKPVVGINFELSIF